MSGIVGVLQLDGRPIKQNVFDRMMNTIEHRGADGSGIWIDGSVGLGHQMLWTTQESLQEKLPLKVGNLVITADARIDNREELIKLLGLSSSLQNNIPDSRLILEAYKKWGRECPGKLLGAFAFAIWDERKQQLFCARDHIGIKPFYYFYSENTFVFASEIKAILCHESVPSMINELRIAYHFELILMTFVDQDITFYKNVYRLLPAHSLSVTQANFRKQSYWELDPYREIQLASDEAYAETFREKFVEAVRCRMRSAYPIGGSLSGGLDSSAVVSAASTILAENGQGEYHSYSAIFDNAPSADERDFIQAVIDQYLGVVNYHFTYPDKISPLVDFEQVFYHMDGPFYGVNYFMPWGIFKSAHKDGVRIFMDGTDGDIAVSHGTDYLTKLARQGDWKKFSDETRAVVRNFNNPRYATEHSILNGYGLPHLTDLVRHGKFKSFVSNVKDIQKYFDISQRKIIKKWGIKPFIPSTVLNLLGKNQRKIGSTPSLYNQEFFKQAHITEKRQKLLDARKALNNRERENHYYDLRSAALPYSLEWINKLASAHKIETRHPFCDIRLLEFCLALPPEQKLKNGWSRWVLRNGLKDVLPESIRWRTGKGTLREVSNKGLLSFEQAYMRETIDQHGHLIDDFVDIRVLKSNLEKYIDQKNPEYVEDIWLSINLIQWFRN